ALARAHLRHAPKNAPTFTSHRNMKEHAMHTWISGLVCSLILAGCATVAPQQDEADQPRSAVEAVYDGFAAGDIALATSTMSPEIVWLEAEGNPYSDLN